MSRIGGPCSRRRQNYPSSNDAHYATNRKHTSPSLSRRVDHIILILDGEVRKPFTVRRPFIAQAPSSTARSALARTLIIDSQSVKAAETVSQAARGFDTLEEVQRTAPGGPLAPALMQPRIIQIWADSDSAYAGQSPFPAPAGGLSPCAQRSNSSGIGFSGPCEHVDHEAIRRSNGRAGRP